MSLCLFQLFFLFLFKRFLRPLAESAELEVDFKLRKPGCEATTRFNLLPDAMLEDWRETRFFFFCVEVTAVAPPAGLTV